MAEPARRRTSRLSRESEADEPPSLDPLAIEHAYRRERARRRARVARRRAARRSNLRFWIAMLVLVFIAVLLLLAAWHEVQVLFGV